MATPLMIIGDYPSAYDANAGTVMRSDKDTYFWSTLEDICGVPKSDVYATYAVKYRPDNGKPTPKDIEDYREELKREILKVRPKAILLLGTMAMQALGYSGNIDKLRRIGYDYTIKTDDKNPDKFTTKVYITYSPYQVYIVTKTTPSAKLEYNFARDICKAHNTAIDQKSVLDLTKIVMCETFAKIKELVGYIKQVGECAFDFETTELAEEGIHAKDFRATALSFSFQHGSSWVIPLDHEESPFTKEQVNKILKYISVNVWANPDIRKIGQNVKFDMTVAAKYGFTKFLGRIDDTMLMHHLLWEYKLHGLKEWATEFIPSYDGYDEEVKAYGYSLAPMKILAPYAGTDTDLTFRGCTHFEALLLKKPRLYTLYRNLTMIALKALYKAEIEGIHVSRKVLHENIKRATELLNIQTAKLRTYPEVARYEKFRIKELTEKKIEQLRKAKDKLKTDKGKAKRDEDINALRTGKVKLEPKPLDFTSPTQISGLIYSKGGFNFTKIWDRKKKEYSTSTNAKFLKLLGDKSGFIRDFMIHRTIFKNLTTYFEGFLDLLDDNERIHTTYLLSGTLTGRLASRNPNLQNISKHAKINDPLVKEVVAMVMQSFCALQGYAIMQADYSQAELRIIADFAEETTMINAYNSGEDLHKLTGIAVAKTTLEEFEKMDDYTKGKIRQDAKPVNFGYAFGQQAAGFKDYAKDKYEVDFTLEEAEENRNIYFSLYPGLLDYHRDTILDAHRYGYVETLLGRRRHAINLNSGDDYLIAADERECINSRVQGTCAEMTLLAISLLQYRLPKSVKFVNTVHDSMIFYVPYHLVPYAASVIKDTAENLPTEFYFGSKLRFLKLVADIEVSVTDWKHMKKYTPDNWAEMLKTVQ